MLGIVGKPERGDTVVALTPQRQRERLAVPEILLRPLLFACAVDRSVGQGLDCRMRLVRRGTDGRSGIASSKPAN